ncbi:hypothetical protein [Microbacterium sp. 69-10]|nr:hypothetical protein [Microbacterium sp. 69-10]
MDPALLLPLFAKAAEAQPIVVVHDGRGEPARSQPVFTYRRSRA